MISYDKYKEKYDDFKKNGSGMPEGEIVYIISLLEIDNKQGLPQTLRVEYSAERTPVVYDNIDKISIVDERKVKLEISKYGYSASSICFSLNNKIIVFKCTLNKPRKLDNKTQL